MRAVSPRKGRFWRAWTTILAERQDALNQAVIALRPAGDLPLCVARADSMDMPAATGSGTQQRSTPD